ncbi:hypothetical protein J1N35_018946 [Gossypium stocksii]|uniref:Aminotransferase-like plant mobile domain-containing protein n=1 Tax=Gossypium stocksii TaxID=47602 RepID=A0A9D4A6M6_9ROSI|nr:hypothetical protein J1N35_018946 [Gossypium stocksii]
MNMLVERWRPKTHIFHLPCSECTITLEDIALQLDLPMDGLVIIGSTVVRGSRPLHNNVGEGLEQLRWWNHERSCVELPKELEDTRSVGQLRDVGCKGSLDSVYDGGNAQIRPSSTIHILGHRHPPYTIPYANVNVGPHIGIDVDVYTTINDIPDANAHAFVYTTIDDIPDANDHAFVYAGVDAQVYADVFGIWGTL